MKNILLAISGLTPQIVTETFYVLTVVEKVKIDEIYILTTQRGKAVLEGKDDGNNTPKTSFRKELKELCNNNNIEHPKFSIKKNVLLAQEESTSMYDVKTDKENILFPNKAAEIIKKITRNENTTIFASLSGGRKSMAAHLALVMSLFARQQDKLFHIITDEKYEFKNFYPKTVQEANALILAEIPFVKLRCINHPILKGNDVYYKIVANTQEHLKFLSENAKLVIHIKQRTISYKENSLHFTPTEIGIYTLFAEKKIAENAGYETNEISQKNFALKLKLVITDNYNYYIDSKDTKHWSVTGVLPDYFLSIKSKINAKIKSLCKNYNVDEQFIIGSYRNWGNTYYSIKAPANKLGVNYE